MMLSFLRFYETDQIQILLCVTILFFIDPHPKVIYEQPITILYQFLSKHQIKLLFKNIFFNDSTKSF